jgi:hypothetical protein
MHIGMRSAESLTNSQIDQFLKASAGIECSGQSRTEVYIWVEKMLVDQEYRQQRKKERGAVRAYLSKVAGLSTRFVDATTPGPVWRTRLPLRPPGSPHRLRDGQTS